YVVRAQRVAILRLTRANTSATAITTHAAWTRPLSAAIALASPPITPTTNAVRTPRTYTDGFDRQDGWPRNRTSSNGSRSTAGKRIGAPAVWGRAGSAAA